MTSNMLYTYANKETEEVIEITQDEMHVAYFMTKKYGMSCGSFTTPLIEAIFHADFRNFEIMKSVYPSLCRAVQGWKDGDLILTFEKIRDKNWELAKGVAILS